MLVNEGDANQQVEDFLEFDWARILETRSTLPTTLSLVTWLSENEPKLFFPDVFFLMALLIGRIASTHFLITRFSKATMLTDDHAI